MSFSGLLPLFSPCMVKAQLRYFLASQGLEYGER